MLYGSETLKYGNCVIFVDE